MGESSITVRPYDGSLASLNLGGVINQSVLNAIGASTGGTISDNDGTLSSADTGTATFSLDGSATEGPITYVGGGTIALLGVGGIELFSRPISIFTVDGQVYFHLPSGLPPLSGLTARITVSPDTPTTLPDFIPCFASGTRIMTRGGTVAVEHILPGDIVLDTNGRHHEVLWVGSNTIDLTALCDDHYRKLVPVRIIAGRLPNKALSRNLVVSQQHRILIRHPLTETMFGVEDCFVTALSMVGFMAEFATEMTEVTYHHILCAEHVTLLANGIAAESLFLGDILREGIRPALKAEIALVFPDLLAMNRGKIRPATAHPTLRTYEARLLTNILAGPARCRLVPTRPPAANPQVPDNRGTRGSDAGVRNRRPQRGRPALAGTNRMPVHQ